MTYEYLEELIRKAGELACDLRNQLEVISNEYNDIWMRTSDPEEETDADILKEVFQNMANLVSPIECALEHEDIEDIIDDVKQFE